MTTTDKTSGHTGSGLTRRTVIQRGGVAALSLSAGGAFLAACGKGDDAGGAVDRGNGQKQIGYSHALGNIPLLATINDVASSYAESIGWELLIDPTTDANLRGQSSTVQNWITLGVPAMCIFPSQLEAFAPLFERARAKDLIVTTYGFTVPDTCGGVLFPPEVSGEQVAEATVAWIKENNPQAKVAVLTSTATPATEPRWGLAIDKINEETEAEIVSEQDALDQATGRRVIGAALQANPDLSVVVGINDDAAVGAAQAFEAAGKDPNEVFVIGNDGTEEALKLIKQDRYLKATAALDIPKLSQAIVDLNVGLVEDTPADQECEVTDLDIPSELVTAQDTARLDELIAGYAST